MARRVNWIGHAGGAAFGLALFLPLPAAAAGLADHAPEIIADLQALREPSLFDYGGHEIAEADGGYLLTLHDVHFAPVEDGYADAGTVVARLVPESGGYRITGFELPKEMPFRDSRGAEIGSIQLDDYDVDGRWSIGEQAFLSLAVQVERLTLAEAKGGTTVAIDSASSSFTDVPAGGGAWREEGRIEIKGLTSNPGSDVGQFALFTLRWSLDDMERDGAEALMRLFGAAAGQADELLEGEGSPDIERLRNVGAVFGSGRVEMEVKDLKIDGGMETPHRIAHGRIEITGEDLKQALTRLTLHLRFDGMEILLPGAAKDDLENVMAPKSLDMSLAITDLPGRAFWGAMLDGMAPRDVPPDQAAMSLLPALQEAGTKLRLDATRFTSEVTDVYAEGMVQAYAPAAFGAVLALSLNVAGLDALSAAARAQAGTDEAAAVLELVDWLEQSGTPSTAPTGAASRRVDIAVDESGQLTVNGQPLSLFGAPPSEMDN